MFLRNCWYVAARDFEIGRTPFSRTLLNEPIVLYRRDDGTPIALEDRCCHRHLPLSHGKLEGNNLRCGYHGLLFSDEGACIEVPGQRHIPAGAVVRSFPLVEQWGWVWIWMGEPARADPKLLPDWSFAGHPGWRKSSNHLLELACDYRLVSDNVLDVTHLAFVHAGSIGSPAILECPAKTEVATRSVHLQRWILDRAAPPLYQSAGKFDGNVDRGQIVDWEPPCHAVNHAICVDAGHGGIDKGGFKMKPGANTKKVHLCALSAPTPETERTTHYFFAFTRSFALDDAEIDKVFNEDMVVVFREDQAVLEAQQRMMALKPDAPQINIQVDAAPVAARKMLSSMISTELARTAGGQPEERA